MQRPIYTAPPPLLSTRTPPNIYTRIPGRGSSGPNGGATTYLPAYETRTSPTSPYGSTTTCTMPLLNGQSNGSLQTNSSLGVGAAGIVSCNTLPHPGSLHAGNSGGGGGISAAMTSSVTSGNITIGAPQTLLTSPRAQTAYSTLGSGGTQSPLLSVGSSLMGVVGGGNGSGSGIGNYETVSS